MKKALAMGMARRQTMALCKRLGGNRPSVFLQRHINGGGDRKESFA
jgi:hypothetical protein